MDNLNKPINNLHNREECPQCHSIFVVGYDPENIRTCPTCKTKFISGQQIDHGDGCSICTARRLKSGKYPVLSKNPKTNDGEIYQLPKYVGSNNVYYKDGCPAIMSDGRFITYYNSTNELTEAMRKMNGFKSPNQFRNFMQKNGDLFMNSERDFIKRENTCSPNTACSEGWYNLWTKHGGNWSCANQ